LVFDILSTLFIDNFEIIYRELTILKVNNLFVMLGMLQVITVRPWHLDNEGNRKPLFGAISST